MRKVQDRVSNKHVHHEDTKTMNVCELFGVDSCDDP